MMYNSGNNSRDKLKLLDHLNQMIASHRNSQSSGTNQVYVDDKPITANRFNNAINISGAVITNREPYYASGVPTTVHRTESVFSPQSTNVVPFNGVPIIRGSTVMNNMDCIGSNYNDFKVNGMGSCRNACIADNKCLTWSFDKRNQHCYLKDSASVSCNSNDAYTSGRIQSTFQPTHNVTPVPIHSSSIPTSMPIQLAPRPPTQSVPVQTIPIQTQTPQPPRSPVQPPISPVQPPISPVQPPISPVQPPMSPVPSTPSIKRISTMIPNYIHQEVPGPNRSLNVDSSNACQTACINDDRCASWNFLPQMQDNKNFDRCLLYYGQPTLIGPARGGSHGKIYNQLPY
ncbi:hypothetical protein [Acanthamoeba polyphaga mimivirus]|uniref:Apple domain-containing protein n=1 Tax=Acanthamoeba polyphaga mimivirus TaxID=212035 RepID=A0A0G2Y8U4_MIMIV|nr:hypothetical protein [Acanthamoeba polyphaga mimivirus]